MTEKAGRNDPCPCGSGKKYKKCCLATKEAETPKLVVADAAKRSSLGDGHDHATCGHDHSKDAKDEASGEGEAEPDAAAPRAAHAHGHDDHGKSKPRGG